MTLQAGRGKKRDVGGLVNKKKAKGHTSNFAGLRNPEIRTQHKTGRRVSPKRPG